MFTIDQNEFRDIMSILEAHCVFECPREDETCYTFDCDIGKIYDILCSHLNNDFIEEDDLPF